MIKYRLIFEKVEKLTKMDWFIFKNKLTRT
jgi:hypothetical protein